MGCRLLEGLSFGEYNQIPYNTWIDRNGIVTPDATPDVMAVDSLTPIATNGAETLVITVDTKSACEPNVYVLLWDERGNCLGCSGVTFAIGHPVNSSNYFTTNSRSEQTGWLDTLIPALSLSNVYGFNIFVAGFSSSNTLNLHYKIV